jgi:hypothetical protein
MHAIAAHQLPGISQVLATDFLLEIQLIMPEEKGKNLHASDYSVLSMS